MNTFEYTPEIIALLEKSARIGWWRADFGTQTLVCSDYLKSLLGVEDGEVPLEVFFEKLPAAFQERLRSEASLTDQEIGYFEYQFLLDSTIGEVWMYIRMCKTTPKEDGSFVVEGFARCLDEQEQSKLSDKLVEEVVPMLHWHTIASKLLLRIIYGEDSSSIFCDTLDVVRNQYKCDRVFMALFNQTDQNFSIRYESRVEDIIPASDVIKQLDFSQAPWLIPTITSGQPVFLDTLDNLPPEAVGEKTFLAEHGVASAIFLPLVSEKGVWGYFGVASNTPRLWSSFEREWLVVMSYFISVCFELNRSQQELAKESEYLKSLYMNMPLGFARLKLFCEQDRVIDFAVLDANNTMLEHAGLSKSELMAVRGDEILQVFIGFNDLLELFGAIGANGGMAQREIINSATGHHYRQTFYSPHENEMVVLSLDITARVKATAALERNEQMLRLIYKNIPVGVELYDKNAKLITSNKAACDIFQARIEDKIGSCMFDWPSFASRPDLIEKVLQGEDVDFDKSYEFALDGSGMKLDTPRHLSFQCIIIKDRDGQVENYLLMVIDNTEKIQTYLNLKHFQDSLGSISEFAQVGMFEWDVMNRTVAGTEQCYKNLNAASGASLDEIIALVHPEDLQTLSEYLDKIKKGSISQFSHEVRIREGHGWKWLRVMYQVTQFDMSNGYIHIFGLNIDISGMKAIELNLREAKLKAEESDRIKTAFLSSMSHEIRTPLNAIIGFSNLLGETKDEEMRSYLLGVIELNNRLLLQLVSDILDFSSIEAGILNILPSEINVNQLIEQILDLQRGNIPVNVQLVTAPCESNVLIYSDKNRIQQMLSQFISNAAKFTQQGSIRVGYTICGPHIEFWVQDSGIGMSPEQTLVVFDRFVKFDEFSQGTGLGLSICKSIIDVMGGQIGVESESGHGSRFWFKIPTTVQSISENLEILEPSATSKKPMILVAEDANLNYTLISSILRNEYRLVHARNGAEAVELFRKHNPDLVLMDLKMPVMDGFQATQLIRQISQTVPVIALTAFAMDSDRKAALDAGCTGFLSKPVITSEIRSALRKCLFEKKIEL